MAKAVFTTKIDPNYDDLPEERYHFPKTYLRQAEAAVGDSIVYYEPRRSTASANSRGGRQAYFATARVADISPDRSLSDHYYALVTDYLEFDHAVPFRDGEAYYESALRRNDGATSKGAFGRAVRIVTDTEYENILRAGFVQSLVETTTAETKTDRLVGFGDPLEPFERPIIERVIARPFRDAAFALAVKSAYRDTCAMTGIKIVNGGGRSEVQAAHIRPVAYAGPDSVRNGIALSGTMHWMFDRGLIGIDDDLRLLVSPGKVPDAVQRMLNHNGMLVRPTRDEFLPHQTFLQFHRENVFKR